MPLLIALARQAYVIHSEEGLPQSICETDHEIAAADVSGELGALALANGEIVIVGSTDHTRIATGIAEPVGSLLVRSSDPFRALVGTDDSAHLYSISDGSPGERVAEFDALACRKDWYTPWGGPPAVRCLASSSDGWVYADIHVGSIMRSPDGGASWEPVTPELHPDVHQVAVTPAAPSRVYANTADAVFVSDDRGASWRQASRGLSARYGRGLAVHPTDPHVVLASVSRGPRGGDARLFRSEDAGNTWNAVDGEFPASCERNIDTFQIAFTRDGAAWAAVGTTLYVGRDGGADWRFHWEAPQEIRLLAS